MTTIHVNGHTKVMTHGDDELDNLVNLIKNKIEYYARSDNLEEFKKYVDLIKFEGKELSHLPAGPKVKDYISDKIKLERGIFYLFSSF